jgi:hypothetical protein
MEMPKPDAHHEKLHALLGTWIGEEKLSPSPWGPGGAATARVTARLDLEGFFVISDYVEEKEGRTVYRGHGVYGWNEREKEYVWYWFDSMGTPPPQPARGTFQGNTLLFEQHAGGFHARYTYVFPEPGRYRFKIENSRDGVSWQTFMEGDYRRA